MYLKNVHTNTKKKKKLLLGRDEYGDFTKEKKNPHIIDHFGLI